MAIDTATPAPVSSATPSPEKKTRREINILAGFGHLFLAVWALLIIAPLVWTFLASFKDNEEIFGDAWTLPATLRFDNWARAWTEANVGQYFLNSVFVVSLSTAGTMLLGAMAAYVLARYTFFGNRIIYYLFVSGLASRCSWRWSRSSSWYATWGCSTRTSA